jgi:hypothetical protein
MVSTQLTCALVCALSALLGSPETVPSRSASSQPLASSRDAGSSCLARKTVLWPRRSVGLHHDALFLDDEVEIPDEPEDNEPDDPGFADDDDDRSPLILGFDDTSAMPRPVVARPSQCYDNVTDGLYRLRFLRLLRLLI